MPPLLALSGPSSSGKTTIARLLRAILPTPTLLIHEDDYYRPAADLPTRGGHQDWDSADAIDTPALCASLEHARAYGVLPPACAISKEEEVDHDECGEGERFAEVVQELRGAVQRWVERRERRGGNESQGERRAGEEARREARREVRKEAGKEAGNPEANKEANEETAKPQKNLPPPPWPGLIILDGFLLLSDSVLPLRNLSSIRILLRTTRAAATARRAQRAGYRTAEGHWDDPEGYMDEVVWPSYVEAHGFLFEAGDVEGRVQEVVAAELGMRICPAVDWGVERCLRWVLGVVLEELEELDERDGRDGRDGKNGRTTEEVGRTVECVDDR